MAKNKIAYYTKSARTKTTDIIGNVAASTVFTAGADGTKVSMINLSLNIPAGFLLSVNDGAVDHPILEGAYATKDALDSTFLPKGPNGMRYLHLESGWSLKVFCTTSIRVVVYGEDY